MSERNGDYCQKCGAPVDPTDEKCPNGHVLAEVGRSFVRSAPAAMKMEARANYHMRIKYISGGKTSYFYEVNKSKELVEGTALQIENLVPAIRFEGHRIYPKRINEYKIFVTESPSEMRPESVRDNHPDGYDFGGDDVTLEITMGGPKPIYHCVKCDAIVNPTDEKCPNGHDLSIVGKKIKLTLTEKLTLSDSVTITRGEVINDIEGKVKDLELEPITPELKAKIDEILDDVEFLKGIVIDVRDQTSPPTLFQRIQENIIDYIITFGIGLAAGLLVR